MGHRSTFRHLLAASLTAAAVLAAAAAPAHATFEGREGRIAVEATTCVTAKRCAPATRRAVLVSPVTGLVSPLGAAGAALREPQFSPTGTKLIGVDPATRKLTVTAADGTAPQTIETAQTPVDAAWGVDSQRPEGSPIYSDGQTAYYQGADGFVTGERGTTGPLRLGASTAGSFNGRGVLDLTPTIVGDAGSRRAAQFVFDFSVFGDGYIDLFGPLPADTEETAFDIRTRNRGEIASFAVVRTTRTVDGVRSELRTLDADADRIVATIPAAIDSIAISPNGRRVAFVSDGALRVVPLVGGAVRTLSKPLFRRFSGRISWQARP